MIKIHSHTNNSITFLIDGKKVVYCRLKKDKSRKQRDIEKELKNQRNNKLIIYMDGKL